MSYTIRKTDGTELVVLQDGSIDTNTSMALVGRNYTGYGELQNQNFVFLLENFANTAPPPRPILGQTWFNTVENNLNVYDGSRWTIVGTAVVGTEIPSDPPIGQLWFNNFENTLYCFIGEWIAIGPESVRGFGKTKSESTTLLDRNGTIRPVIIMYVNDSIQAIISSEEFTLNEANRPTGFTTLIRGMNFPDRGTLANIQGKLQGNASSATILETMRLINGIGFNGSEDITITAATPFNLVKGTYLVGNNFNGSQQQTWSVDATPNNTIGTVVARNGSGDFSAGTITADLVGDVSGNVTATTGNSTFDTVTANRFIGASLSGNANSATKLRTSRTINGVSFDGTEDITIPVVGTNVTGTRLANNIVNSNLSTVGTLSELFVDDRGIKIGGILNFNIDSGISNISVDNDSGLEIKVRDTNLPANYSNLTFLAAPANLAQGGENVSALVPNNSIDLGTSSKSYNKIYASTFIGDVQGTSTNAVNSVTSTNLSGGGTGAIPYQTATGTTNFIPAGTAGQVLKSTGSSQPVWDAIVFSTLSRGAYLTGSNYDGFVNTTWNVDATSSNVANKVVARDSSGNFSANTITATLNGNVNGNLSGTVFGNVSGNSLTATRLQTSRTINGVAFNGTANITVFDSTKAPVNSPTLTGTPRSTTPPFGDNSTRIATTAFVQQILAEPIWAGNTITTLANIITTYSNNVSFPIGTRVAFYEATSVTLFGGNGNVTFNDRYRRVVQKIDNSNTWIDVGG